MRKVAKRPIAVGALILAASLLCPRQTSQPRRHFERFKPAPALVSPAQEGIDPQPPVRSQQADSVTDAPEPVREQVQPAADALPVCLCPASQPPDAPHPPDFSELQRALRRGSKEERSEIASRLGVFACTLNRMAREESLRLLQRALRDEDESVRSSAACSLGAAALYEKAEPRTRESIAGQLIRLLDDPSEKVVVCAIEQLGGIELIIIDDRLRYEPPNPRIRTNIDRALRKRMFGDYESPIARKIERMMHQLWCTAHHL